MITIVLPAWLVWLSIAFFILWAVLNLVIVYYRRELVKAQKLYNKCIGAK